MTTASITSGHSPHYQEIDRWFHGIQAPYRLKDIQAFNAIYRRTYSSLNREEKRRVEEEIVNALIDGVETPKLKAKIFGVV